MSFTNYCTPPIRWTCSDAVVGQCKPDKNGKYVTKDQCQRALQCKLGTPTYPADKTVPLIHGDVSYKQALGYANADDSKFYDRGRTH